MHSVNFFIRSLRVLPQLPKCCHCCQLEDTCGWKSLGDLTTGPHAGAIVTPRCVFVLALMSGGQKPFFAANLLYPEESSCP